MLYVHSFLYNCALLLLCNPFSCCQSTNSTAAAAVANADAAVAASFAASANDKDDDNDNDDVATDEPMMDVRPLNLVSYISNHIQYSFRLASTM